MVDDEGRRDTVIDGHGATLRPASAGPVTHPLGSAPRPSSPLLDLEGSRYKLGEALGQGGMGEVIVAVDEQIGREVAVKRIRGDQPSDEEVARFVREARVQARLEHPAVVPVHDIATDRSGKPFFVMKRIAGTEMKELLAQLGGSDGTATRSRLLRAFADVCLAVEFAHNRGIVHRDLKPANIMLGDYGEVYVLDWGIARAITDANESIQGGQGDLALATGETQAGAVLGTPAYMAPEQVVGQSAGTAADIYALGCILYEIAAGVPLHEGPRSLASAITSADSSPSLRRADSPPELDAICTRATAVEIENRYASARALGEAVQAFLDGDRDVTARRELAQHHIAEARIAREQGDRQRAMRAAGRALALDPTAEDAAELVTHLMLVPPKQVPDEIEQHLEAIDVATGRSQARIGAVAMTGYLWFVPLLWWTGVKDWRVVIAFAGFAMLSAGHIYLMSRSTKIPTGAIYVSAVINATLIGLVCRLVGPFLIAPTLVLTTLMAFAVHPRFGKMHIVAAILTLGVAVPWTLEAAGVLPPTYRFEAGAIVIDSPAVTFSPQPVQLAFGLVLVLLVAITAILLRMMATRQREATKQIEVQAWHLRQLIPR